MSLRASFDTICMMLVSKVLGLVFATVAVVTCQWNTSGLEIQTNTGLVTGFINSTAPSVRQFLGIPYSVPPTGQRRWLPPLALPVNRESRINATKFPPSCPQFPTDSIVYNDLVPQFVTINSKYDQYHKTSEDCLSLAVWTPVDAGSDARLPVIMFMTGGAFDVGGIDIAYQLPYHWVERTRSHIVVTINYRVNVFGFPNARGLSSQNLGILDQRVALEWVRDNIRMFGGDPERITLWGQSAGGISVDYHNFAFPNDTIASGLFMDSGSVFLDLTTTDFAQTNFTFLAAQLGCGNLTPQAELVCMRKVDFQVIENFLEAYANNNTQPALTFHPIADENIVFSNYTQRYSIGAFSHLPALFTTGANEGTALVPIESAAVGPNQTLAALRTLQDFTCPAALSTRLRTAQGRLTYRWQCAANFSNVSPRPWLGTYHSADLPYLFGTHQDFRGNSTEFEFATSFAMQDYLLAFMKDPINGPRQFGWQSTASDMLPRFGADNLAVQNASQTNIDQPCST